MSDWFKLFWTVQEYEKDLFEHLLSDQFRLELVDRYPEMLDIDLTKVDQRIIELETIELMATNKTTLIEAFNQQITDQLIDISCSQAILQATLSDGSLSIDYVSIHPPLRGKSIFSNFLGYLSQLDSINQIIWNDAINDSPKLCQKLLLFGKHSDYDQSTNSYIWKR